MAMQYVADL